MALRVLSLLLFVVAGKADETAHVTHEASSVQTVNKTNETSSTWSNFVHCKCGLSCVKQMGSWYIFNVGQSCACDACPDEASSGNLRGKAAGNTDEASLPKDHSEEVAKESSETKNLKSIPIPSESFEKTWDSAMVPGTNLLYCALISNQWFYANITSWQLGIVF